ncbi:MAG: PAS domain S-box protein, partial [Candidatus Thermoplasmatota archaeon]
RMCEMYGYSREEALELTIEDLSSGEHPYTQEEAQKRIQKTKEEGPITFEWRAQKKDGTLFWVEVTLKEAEIAGESKILASIRDISERKETEEHYRTIVETSPETIAITDLEGKIIDCNQKAVEMLELPSKDKLIGKSAFDIIAPEDREKAAENLEKTLEKGEIRNIEYTILDFDGNEFLAEISVSVIQDAEGNPVSFMAIVRDITERKVAKKYLEENKNKIERLHEISAELQTYDSEEDIYSFAVEAAEDVLEFDICEISVPEDDVMKGLVRSSELTEKVSSKSNPLPIDNSVAGKTYLENRSFIVEDIHVEDQANPTLERFKSAISVPIGEHGIFQALSTDVDDFGEEDLKMAELLMDHVKEALERVEMEEREEFLYSLLRHDVQNKTQLVKGYLDLLEEDIDLPDEADDYIQKAKKVARASDEIIEKVRKLNQIKEEDEIGDVEVDSVLDQVLSEHESQLEKENIDVEVQTSGCKVKGGTLLQEMISNLVENSIKHSDCDNIRIRGEYEGDECVVTVEDDGKGVPDKNKEKIFEKGFKEGENAGSGLGMYLAKEIVESYGGSVEVKDSELGGVRFDIALEKAENLND